MTFTPEQTAALASPLARASVKKNPRGYDYVEAWHAIAEANRIFGFDAWARETVLLQETNRDLIELTGRDGPYKQWRVGYLAKVRITAGGVIREGTGFGSGMSKPEALGDAIESAAKEAESDAMKRALMTFGNPFGLALYDKAQAEVTDSRPAPAVTGVITGRQLQQAQQRAEIDLNVEMDACKTKTALLAWEQFRLKEIGRLSKADGAPLAAKFGKLLASLPDDTLALTAADVPEFA